MAERASLGEMLQAAREDAGLTKVELGRRVGVTGARISQIEQDGAPPPPLLRKLAKALELDPRELEIARQAAQVSAARETVEREERKLRRLLERYGRL